MGAAAVPLITGGLGLLGASKAASAQKAASRGANSVSKAQLGLFNQASPNYGSVLQYLMGNARLSPNGPAGSLSPHLAAGERTATAGGQGSLPAGALGIYGQNPADVYRLREAEEGLARQRSERENALRFRLGRQGAGEATTAGALRQNESDYLGQMGQFQRGLAINAGGEQERRVMQLLQALGVGFGQGGAAAAGYQNAAASAGNQLGQSGGMLGQALSDLLLARIMRRQGGTPGIAGPLPSYEHNWRSFPGGYG